MKHLILIIGISLLFSCATTRPNCPMCGEYQCIYFEIQNTPGDAKTAIDEVTRRRGITDSATINILYKEYNL